MFLVKTSIWLLLYPAMVVAFALRICFSTISFLFHSPVDTWTLIGKAVNEAEKELQ